MAWTDVWQRSYANSWQHINQQGAQRFAGTYQDKNCSGELFAFDQIGVVNTTDITADSDTNATAAQRIGAGAVNNSDTNAIELPVTVRNIVPSHFEQVVRFNEFSDDYLAAQSKPTSETLTAMRMGMNRTMDASFLTAALGTAKTGKGGAANTALPAGQKTTVNTGAETLLGKILDAKQILEENEAYGQDVDPVSGVEIAGYVCLNARGFRKLYDEQQVTSSDYANDIWALYHGRIDHFLGLKWIRSESIANSGDDIDSYVMWAKSGMAGGLWTTGTNFYVDQLPERRHVLQLRGTCSFGFTRSLEGSVVQIDYDYTPA